jgi:hypothetical protein
MLRAQLKTEENKAEEKGGGISAPFGVCLGDNSESADRKGSGPRVPHVCICGHSIGSHKEMSYGGWSCTNGKLWCPCETPRAVLEASDLRDFHFSTYGWGDRHALSLGIMKSIRKGRRVRQLIENNCFKCGLGFERLIPTSLSSDYFVLDYPGPRNALLCSDCWSGFPIRP